MSSKQPLNDTWLFWDAERIDDFPHASDDDYGRTANHRDNESDEQESSQLALVENLLLCVGGISAAMAGMGLVILIGSFLSAYSALNGPLAGEEAVAPTQPYLSLQRPAPEAQMPPPPSIVLEPSESESAPAGEVSPARSTGSPRAPAAI